MAVLGQAFAMAAGADLVVLDSDDTAGWISGARLGANLGVLAESPRWIRGLCVEGGYLLGVEGGY